MVCLGAPAERGDSRRAGQPPVLVGLGVEPHEPQQPVQPDAREQVSDLRGLARREARAGLGDEDRSGSGPHPQAGPNNEENLVAAE